MSDSVAESITCIYELGDISCANIYWAARSWRIKGVVEFARDPRVSLVKVDQCMFGIKACSCRRARVASTSEDVYTFYVEQLGDH